MALTLPFVVMPTYKVALENITIELWVSERKLPLALRADAIVVPVAPDLKMVFGIAKMVRDYGADAIQIEANKAAPLAPGDAFVGTGAKYRYRYTALAVIFDSVKRTSAELVTDSIGKAMRMLRERDVRSVIFPDMTENLLTQPNWISPEQRQATAEATARLMLDAIVKGGVTVRTVKIWAWNKENAAAFISEMKKLKQTQNQVRVQSA